MKHISTDARLIAGHHSLAGGGASDEAQVTRREEHLGTRSRLARSFAILALAIGSMVTPVIAQETGTVTISGTFSMDYLNGETELSYYAPDLLAVYYNGHEHTWTLTLHGTTQSHYYTDIDYVEADQDTWIDATSFDLEFFGPDAATLNGFVSDHFAVGGVQVLLRNHFMYYSDDDFGIMYVRVSGSDGMYFDTYQGYGTLFPSDADGYPVVGPDPFSIETYSTELGSFDQWSSTGGAIGSLAGLVTFEGSVGSEPPPATLSIGDASVVEGNRGSTQMQFTVSRSGSSEGTVSVDYRTVAGTALAKSDYSAASGTLVFQPGVSIQTITITVKSDRKREPDETFTVELFNPVGASVADAVATGTILNDD